MVQFKGDVCNEMAGNMERVLISPLFLAQFPSGISPVVLTLRPCYGSLLWSPGCRRQPERFLGGCMVRWEKAAGICSDKDRPGPEEENTLAPTGSCTPQCSPVQLTPQGGMQMTCARKTVLASVVLLSFVMVLPTLGGSPAPLANKVYGVTLTPEQELSLIHI